MKEFFKSKGFKIFIALIFVFFGLMIGSATSRRDVSFPSAIIGAIVTPIQSIIARITGAADSAGSYFADPALLTREVEAQKEEIALLRQQLVDFETMKQQNQQYQDILNIQEDRDDFTMEAALVVARDPSELYGGFTINAGSLQGIKLKDPVVTSAGVVGFVSEVGPNFSKVTTLLNPDSNIGGYDITGHEYGILSGNAELAGNGLCMLAYLPKDCAVSTGNTIITSGTGGVFPSGLVCGVVQTVQADLQGVSINAIIKPAVDIADVKEVLIIKSFDPDRALPVTSSLTDSAATTSSGVSGSSSAVSN